LPWDSCRTCAPTSSPPPARPASARSSRDPPSPTSSPTSSPKPAADRAAAVNPYLELLRRNRNYRLLFFGQTVSQLGDWFNTVAVYALILDLTRSATAVAWMMIVQFLPFALVGPMAGVVVDRVN